MTARGTNWRVKKETERRRAALVALLETGERQIDRLRAEELLQGLDVNRAVHKQALAEVDQLRADVARLQSENAALVAEVAELEGQLRPVSLDFSSQSGSSRKAWKSRKGHLYGRASWYTENP
jgi:hypothetical protein